MLPHMGMLAEKLLYAALKAQPEAMTGRNIR